MLVTESTSEPGAVSLLILGAGWTSTFLIPLLEREGVTHAATTTNGRDGTIPFKFDPDSDDTSQFAALPAATTVMITFPLKGEGQAARLVKLYAETHGGKGGGSSSSSSSATPNYIQLGVTTVWTGPGWQDESSPHDTSNPRAVAEDELMRGSGAPAAVLALAALYGADRQPRDWFRRVVRSRDDLRAKGALHVVHGEDVARAVLALHRRFTPGKRWILCDMHVYDWWDLVQDWALRTPDVGAEGVGEKGEGEGQTVSRREMSAWVGQLMAEEGVRALPRDTSSLGRRLDGRGFWRHMGIWPTQGRMR